MDSTRLRKKVPPQSIAKPPGRQLGLSLHPKLPYEAGGFVLHSGVRQVCEDLALLVQDSVQESLYPLISIVGDDRSGKTHLSIYLFQQFFQQHPYVELLEGAELKGDLPNLSFRLRDKERPIVFVDDADHYLSTLGPGESGALVELIEELRAVEGFLILFRKSSLECYQIDEHLRSRFLAGNELQIGPPGREEVSSLIEVLGRQRGITFSQKKVQYLGKRVGGTIRDIEGYLDRMLVLARVRGEKISFPLLGDAL